MVAGGSPGPPRSARTRAGAAATALLTLLLGPGLVHLAPEAQPGPAAAYGLAAAALAAVLWTGSLAQALLVVVPAALALVWTCGLLGWAAPATPWGEEAAALAVGLGAAAAVVVAGVRLEVRRGCADRAGPADAAALLGGLAAAGAGSALVLSSAPEVRALALPGATACLAGTGAALLAAPPLARVLLGRPGEGAPGLRELGAVLRLALRSPDGGPPPLTARGTAALFRPLGPLVARRAAWRLSRDRLLGRLPELVPGSGGVAVAAADAGLVAACLARAFPGRALRAVEPDVRSAALARAALGDAPGLRVATGGLEDLPLQAVEAVVLWEVLGPLPDAAAADVLARVAAALPPGGRLVFRDVVAGGGPAPAAWRGLRGALARLGAAEPPGPVRSATDWARLLNRCGLAVVRSDAEAGPFRDHLVLVGRLPG